MPISSENMAKTLRIPLIILMFLGGLHFAAAQEPVKPETLNTTKIEENIEQLSEQTDTELDYSELLDDLYQLIQHPINLNKAREWELKRLQLNDQQISNLTGYIQKYGEITSIYELNLVEGFDSTLVTTLSPFVSFILEPPGAKPTFQNLVKYGRHQLLTRYQQVLQPQAGYAPISDSALRLKPNSRFLGGPEKLYLRYGYNFYNKVRFGVTMEKDPGETFWPKADSLTKGFDFYSVHFFYSGDKFIRYLAIGDYHLGFGQGLTMFSTLAFGKSAYAIVNRRIAQPVKPNTGVNENLFMRGAAVTVAPLQNIDLTLFYSGKKVDVNVGATDSLTAETLFISSLQETGYHRTPGELAGKNAIRQTVYGGNIQARIKMFRLGATAYHTELGSDLIRRESLYNKFDFRGKSLDNFGFDAAAILRSLTFFGEVSGSGNGGKAMLLGGTATPDPRFAISAVYRNYGKDYQNFFSNAFAEGSRNANEKGLYVGIFAQLLTKWSLTAYSDYFRSDWLRYRVDAPSTGREYLVQLTHNPTRYSEVYLRYRFKQKQLNPSGSSGYIKYPEDETRQNLRLHFSYRATASITLKSRIETTWREMSGSGQKKGFLIYQDIIYNAPEKPWLLNTRFALFDTDTYDERLYAYESDVLYAFSIPAYYYRGSRFYLMGKYSIGRRLDLWVRYSLTYYNNRSVIGSGLDQIDGNHKSDIKIQARIKF